MNDEWKDPICEFFELAHDFDFEKASNKLTEIQEFVADDYFLKKYKDAIISNVKQFMFEMYSKIYSRSSVATVKKLFHSSMVDDFLSDVCVLEKVVIILSK
jgi:hypothetical protein